MLVVLHQGAIGDFLLALSVVGAVREALGSARVEVIASAASARWAAGRSIVDRYHNPDSVGVHTLFAHDGPLDERLSRLLLSASPVLSFLAGPDEAIHERLKGATASRVISVDPRPREETLRARTHITDQWTAEIRRQGLAIGEPVSPRVRAVGQVSTCRYSSNGTPCTGDVSETAAGCGRLRRPPPALPDGDISETEAGYGRLRRPPPALPVATSTRRVIIHPGSGGRHKCWPMESFLALADALAGDGVHVAWMLGPAECEAANESGEAIRQRAAERMVGRMTHPTNGGAAEEIIVEDDLSAAAERIASCALYIGNDGGMTHVAAATGVPTLAIFTATDPHVWRPLGENAIAVDARSEPGASVTHIMDHASSVLKA